jgi:predicted transcriptional regulator
MNQVTFTFRVDAPLKEQFTAAAKGRDRTGAQLLRDFMREYVRRQDAVEHDAWFRAQVDLAIQEADAPGAVWVSNEDATQQWADQRAALLKTHQGAGA